MTLDAHPDRGLYNKYHVSKQEEPTDPEAQYFVLRMDTDPQARAALRLYASMITDRQPHLAQNIRHQCQVVEDKQREVLAGLGAVDDAVEEILEAVSEVYCYITNGLISKPATIPTIVKAHFDDFVIALVDEAKDEIVDACARLLCPRCRTDGTVWETDPVLIDNLWRHRKKGRSGITTACQGHVIREGMGNLPNPDVDLPLRPATHGGEVNAVTKAVHQALTNIDGRLPWTTAMVYDPLAVSVEWLVDRIETMLRHYIYLACRTACRHCEPTTEYYNHEPYYDEKFNCWQHPTREKPEASRPQVCQASSIRNAVSPFTPSKIRM